MKADTLAMLVFLSRQGDEGFEKAAYVSWLGASSEGIRPPPRAAGRATLHKLSASLRQEHASGRRPDPAQLALPHAHEPAERSASIASRSSGAAGVGAARVGAAGEGAAGQGATRV